jgi:hypothetical protein
MTTQPLANRETIPTQTQPAMPGIGGPGKAAPPKPVGKTPPRKSPPMSAEKAQISRQNSLRKQRKAQKANALLK